MMHIQLGLTLLILNHLATSITESLQGLAMCHKFAILHER